LSGWLRSSRLLVRVVLEPTHDDHLDLVQEAHVRVGGELRVRDGHVNVSERVLKRLGLRLCGACHLQQFLGDRRGGVCDPVCEGLGTVGTAGESLDADVDLSAARRKGSPIGDPLNATVLVGHDSS
jgi:hypothetical protein